MLLCVIGECVVIWGKIIVVSSPQILAGAERKIRNEPREADTCIRPFDHHSYYVSARLFTHRFFFLSQSLMHF
jgi:hypothetical protein